MRRLVLSLRSPTGYFAEFVGLRASAPTYIRLAGYQVIFREIRLSECRQARMAFSLTFIEIGLGFFC